VTSARRPSLDQQLATLRKLDTAAPGAIDALRAALRSTTGPLVAAAARRVGEDRLDALVEELAPAFARLCEDDAVKRDPGCRGKLAIAVALHALDHWDDRVFVAGLRHVQKEGFDREDTAAHLRGACGLAHAHSARPDALDVIAGLLADDARLTRAAAARALGDAGRPDATALLRFKLLVGDEDPDVLAACAESLLSLSRDGAHDFLLAFLDDHDDRAEVAALALGGARVAAAFEPLVAWCTGARPEQRHRVGYLAIALLRADPATAYLLDAIRGEARAGAVAAARALATFKDDASLAEQIGAAGRDNADAAVRREVDSLLDR
jgi:hypothetical protein